MKHPTERDFPVFQRDTANIFHLLITAVFIRQLFKKRSNVLPCILAESFHIHIIRIS